jgi:flagellar motor switch protein FliN/FliY
VNNTQEGEKIMQDPNMTGASEQGPGNLPTEVGPATVEMQSAEFAAVDQASETTHRERKMDLLLDLTLPVAIELGRTQMMIRDILDLQRGSVVEFDKLASEPVDILINGKKMAEGEVVVIEKHFGIRITNLVDASERVKGLGK